MHIVLVRDERHWLRFQIVECDRAHERADAVSAQICEGAISIAILGADGEHLMKLVVRNADRVGGVAGGRVLNSAHANVEVAALDGLIDLVERHLNEFGLTAEALGDLAGDFDVESAEL